MIIPVVIGMVYLVSAGLLWRSGVMPLAVAAVVLSPVPLLLTLYLRRLAAMLVASAYLQEQADKGLSHEEAVAALEDREEGLTFDTADVAQWPFTAMLVVSVGSVATLGYALYLL